MDPDVVEIPPPIHHHSSSSSSNFYRHQHKNKDVFQVIDVDNDDENSPDVLIIGEKVNISTSNKGKTIDAVHDDHQVVQISGNTFHLHGVENSGSFSMNSSSHGYPSASPNLINVDGLGSDPLYEEDDYSDIFAEDFMDVDEYALLQKHFDNVDIPPGIEAPFTWLPPGHDIGLMNAGDNVMYPWYHMQSNAKRSHTVHPSQPSLSLGPTNSVIQGSSVGSSNIQIKMDNNVDHSSGTVLSSPLTPQPFSQPPHGKKKSAISKHTGHTLNASSGVDSSNTKSHWFLGHFHNKKKSAVFAASTNLGFIDQSEAMKLPHAVEPHAIASQFTSSMGMIAAGSSGSYHPHYIAGPIHPPGIELGKPWWKNTKKFKPFNNNANHIYHPFHPPHAHPEQMFDNTWVRNSAGDVNNGKEVSDPLVTISDEARDEILGNFRSFKQFDTVEDPSDHHFINKNFSMKQHPKNWAKKIQEEWKILEKDLPDSIFVRIYESRMDLLRAVIIGAEGTPYHDGLFFFDVFFPTDYPNVPPQVHYHSGGLRLNPNLYHCGKVCLSLLNTWSGNKNEKWLPGVSTILQVLVSIQGLILNAKPYFNEPGYAHLSGSADGEKKSLRYNEETFILSLRTMMYMMRRPPKNFEDFVKGHFCSRAHNILVACKAYMEGAQVGCLVNGGVQDVDQGDRSCSMRLKDSLSGYMNMIIREFAHTGAKDIETFLIPSTNSNSAQKVIGGIAVAPT